METFTARELNRSPAKVFAAADRDGVARLRSRNGRTYSVKPGVGPMPRIDWESFVQSRRTAVARLGMSRISRRAAASLDRLLARD